MSPLKLFAMLRQLKPIEERVSRLTSAATMSIGVLDHAAGEIAIGRRLGIDATGELPREDFKRP